MDGMFRETLKAGEFPERSKGADCKSVGSAFVGSNPTLPIFSFPVVLSACLAILGVPHVPGAADGMGMIRA